MKRLFTIIFTVLFSAIYTFSQENKLNEKIKAQLNSADKKNITKAEQISDQAVAQMKVADDTESADAKKAYKIRIKASKDLGKANKIMYRVYKQDLKQFFSNVDPVKAKKAEQKIDKAALLMKEAKKSREASLRLNVVKNAYAALKKANDYEAKAIGNLKEVYEMFIGSSSAVGKERPLDITENKEETEEHEIDEVKLEPEKEEKESKNNNEAINNVRQFEPIKILGTRGVFFLIQVAASKTPISEDYLRKNYKEDIHGELIDGWHRYVINKRFATLEETEKYKANTEIRGTLIIAIKNGQKVSIQEAKKKEEFKIDEMEYSPVGGNVAPTKNTSIPESLIVYRLEIGISTSKLNATEVRQLKNGGKAVIPIDRGGWYSYTIGDFKSKTEALNFKRIKRLTDASVLKIKNGKVID